MNPDWLIFIEKAIDWAKANMGSREYAYEQGNQVEIFGGSTAKESADIYRAALNQGEPPLGAFIFYDAFGTINGLYRNWGHVGLSIGEGKVIHAFDRVRIDHHLEMESLPVAEGWAKLKLIGWVPVERVFQGYRRK